MPSTSRGTLSTEELVMLIVGATIALVFFAVVQSAVGESLKQAMLQAFN